MLLPVFTFKYFIITLIKQIIKCLLLRHLWTHHSQISKFFNNFLNFAFPNSDSEYRKKLKRERAEAKQRKARYWKAYFEKYHTLTEKLFNYNIIIPALSNLVLEDLERLLEHPEAYIPNTQGVYFKIFDYDEKNDCYHWIEV